MKNFVAIISLLSIAISTTSIRAQTPPVVRPVTQGYSSSVAGPAPSAVGATLGDWMNVSSPRGAVGQSVYSSVVPTTSAQEPAGPEFSNRTCRCHDRYVCDCCRRTLRVFGGLNFLINSSTNSLFRDTQNLDEQYLFGGAVGIRHAQRIRSELEYTFRRNRGQLDSVARPAYFNSRGHAFLFNGFFEPFANVGRWFPYVGAGFGLAYTDFEESDPNGNLLRFATTKTNFAWQGIIGANRPVGRAILFAEYRFFGAGRVEFQEAGSSVIQQNNYVANNVVFGLRCNF